MPLSWFLVGSVLLIVLVLCGSYYVFLRSEFRVVVSITISAQTLCSVRLYLQLLVRWLMTYLRYLCLFAYCVVFSALFVFVLCLVYPMLPVSLGCLFLIAPSVFSNVYLQRYVWFNQTTWRIHDHVNHCITYTVGLFFTLLVL